jgi:hypothetical protein
MRTYGSILLDDQSDGLLCYARSLAINYRASNITTGHVLLAVFSIFPRTVEFDCEGGETRLYVIKQKLDNLLSNRRTKQKRFLEVFLERFMRKTPLTFSGALNTVLKEAKMLSSDGVITKDELIKALLDNPGSMNDFVKEYKITLVEIRTDPTLSRPEERDWLVHSGFPGKVTIYEILFLRVDTVSETIIALRCFRINPVVPYSVTEIKTGIFQIVISCEKKYNK